MRRAVALVTLVAFVPACGGAPRIQTTVANEPKFSGAEHWVPIPATEKVDKRNSTLILAESELRVLDEKTQPVAWPYTDLGKASYSYSKSPRWGLGASLAFFICLPCLAFAFIKKKSHWLAIDTPDGPQLFKLSKNNYQQLMTGLERAGVTIERLADE